MTTTKFGNKTIVQNKLNANLIALRAFYYNVLLYITTAYSAYVVQFFLGQFLNAIVHC